LSTVSTTEPADWLVRTDTAPDVTRLFKCAYVAQPSRARQATAARTLQIPRKNAAAAPKA
jgi:hypothetical protein